MNRYSICVSPVLNNGSEIKTVTASSAKKAGEIFRELGYAPAKEQIYKIEYLEFRLAQGLFVSYVSTVEAPKGHSEGI